MKELSQQNRALLDFMSKGYYVDEDGELYNKSHQILNPVSNQSGYKFKSHRIGPRKENKQIPIFIHRIQAFQKFKNKIFQKGIVVRHLNNNNKDNSWDNIDIGTARDNHKDKTNESKQAPLIASSKVTRRFSDEKIIEIRTFYKQVRSYKKVMEKFNIGSKGSLYNFLNNEYL